MITLNVEEVDIPNNITIVHSITMPAAAGLRDVIPQGTSLIQSGNVSPHWSQNPTK
uniref:Uncharacterized protein n=1 Tax=Amphimedon queenslandica TaxID=400682 RepID=A0A1X7V034_AMPQE